jgi:hypothetical protein
MAVAEYVRRNDVYGALLRMRPRDVHLRLELARHQLADRRFRSAAAQYSTFVRDLPPQQ